MHDNLSIRNFSLVIALILIWIFFGLMSDAFLGARNLSQLSIELAVTATLALGMLIVLLPGLIDLSVGSGVGLIGGIASVLVFQHHYPAPVAMGIAVLVALLIWRLMGTLIVRQHVPAFIITLGGLLIFKGLFWLVIQNATIPVSAGNTGNIYAALTTFYLPPIYGYLLGAGIFAAIVYGSLRARSQRLAHRFAVEEREILILKLIVIFQGLLLFVLTMNRFRGIPLSVIILGTVAFAVHTITRHTPFGRHLYAIGGNEEAAVLSGIPIQKTIVLAFTLMGAIVALTGFMQTAYAGASTTTVGDLMELDAIAACVIGGTSLKGGRGKVLGVLFGALIMASLLNGMTLLAISPELKFIARGTVLVLAVWMDVRLSRNTPWPA
ncbi:MAG TPA: ATPase [Calditrichia bacterium]|nr:ATPase [Calditrichota bacterium]HQU71953.1 ATPase [Calditrichia bacterium]HQV32060.1 ATPase [Calditrichia bacterium]